MRIGTVRIKSYEKGLYFRNGEMTKILGAGRHWFLNPFASKRLDVVSQRNPWLFHNDLDVIIKSGLLKNEAAVIDLKDKERALVWIDGRFADVLPPGQYVLWNKVREIRVEIIDASDVQFEHKSIDAIMNSGNVSKVIEEISVDEGFVGLYFLDGKYVETLNSGRYLFWRNAGKVKVVTQDVREQMIDVNGQDIMTADKVSLRVNAVITYQIKDPLKAYTQIGDAYQALYREGQLALRAVIGTRKLDTVLSEKDIVSEELKKSIQSKASDFGVGILSLGIRDVILPGDMKELFTRVTEAQKAAEANLISRREEVAAMRSQANTAKMLENNPTLMKLRELEVLEKVAEHSKLNVVLGEQGLTDRVVNLL